MAPQQTTILFNDKYCQVFTWESIRGHPTLSASLRIPMQKASEVLPPEKAAQENAVAFKRALKQAGLQVREALALIPKQWVTSRVTALPSADPAELTEMARFEAERHIPFNVQRHIISHHVLQSDEIEGSRVLIAALDSPPAEEITRFAEAVGVRLTGLDVSTNAQTNALCLSGEWNADADPTVALVDVGFSSADITILDQGIPIFSRSVPLGVDRIVPALSPGDADLESPSPKVEAPGVENEKPAFAPPESPDEASSPEAGDSYADSERFLSWTRRLIKEIRQTYDYAKREFDCRPLSRLFLCGPGAGLQKLAARLEEGLGMRPETLDPFSGRLRLDAGAATVTDQPAAYVTAAGAVLRETEAGVVKIDLLPAQYVRKHRGAQRQRTIAVMALLAAALVASAWFLMDSVVANRESALAFYENELARTEDRAEEISYRKVVVRILKQQNREEGSALAVLNTLSGWQDLFAGGDARRVSLTLFDYDAGDVLRLEGFAKEYRDLNHFISMLEDSGHFDRVRKRESEAVASRVTGGQIIRFTINCYFESRDGS